MLTFLNAADVCRNSRRSRLYYRARLHAPIRQVPQSLPLGRPFVVGPTVSLWRSRQLTSIPSIFWIAAFGTFGESRCMDMPALMEGRALIESAHSEPLPPQRSPWRRKYSANEERGLGRSLQRVPMVYQRSIRCAQMSSWTKSTAADAERGGDDHGGGLALDRERWHRALHIGGIEPGLKCPLPSLVWRQIESRLLREASLPLVAGSRQNEV